MIPEVSATELRAELDGNGPPALLDVRELFELEIARIDPIVHMPMGEVMRRVGELDKSTDWVVICRTGNRSGKVTQFLLGQGFARVRNLAGGLHAWSREVDPTIVAY